MGLVKKLSKLGNARALLLTSDTMALMNLTDEDEVVIEFVGNTMLVRRHDLARPDALSLMDGFERLMDTITLKPEYDAEFGELLRPENRQRILLHLLHYGPSTVLELSEAVGQSRGSINSAVRQFTKLGLINVITGGLGHKYVLAEEKFNL